MSLTITLPDGYVLVGQPCPHFLIIAFSFQYVPLSLLSTVYLLIYQIRTVGKYRKRAGVKYPQRRSLNSPCLLSLQFVAVYAEKAEQENSLEAMQFNCAQRMFLSDHRFGPLFDPFVSKALIKTHWRLFRFCTPRTLFFF